MDVQNEAASLCVNNSINKDLKLTFLVSLLNSKSYPSNSSRIFKIEVMEAVL